MNERLILIFPFAVGVLLGAIFFGGLWWTIRKGLSSNRPALWFLVSLLLRTGITLTGFYLVAESNWERLVACLVGFFITRLIVAWLTRSSSLNKPHLAKEVSDAP